MTKNLNKLKSTSQSLALIFVLLLIGCGASNTVKGPLHIPIESFKEQFSGIDSTNLKMVKTRGPSGHTQEYLAVPIEWIKCVDRNGNDAELQNGPTIESRITTKDGKKTILYFDRIFLANDTLIGHQSRFLGLPKEIPIEEISKIEVQDGHKYFRYVKMKQ